MLYFRNNYIGFGNIPSLQNYKNGSQTHLGSSKNNCGYSDGYLSADFYNMPYFCGRYVTFDSDCLTCRCNTDIKNIVLTAFKKKQNINRIQVKYNSTIEQMRDFCTLLYKSLVQKNSKQIAYYITRIFP